MNFWNVVSPFWGNPQFVLWLTKILDWTPLDILWIFLGYGTFIMLQIIVFWPKIFFNFMHAFKIAILTELKNCQNGTLAQSYLFSKPEAKLFSKYIVWPTLFPVGSIFVGMLSWKFCKTSTACSIPIPACKMLCSV